MLNVNRLYMNHLCKHSHLTSTMIGQVHCKNTICSSEFCGYAWLRRQGVYALPLCIHLVLINGMGRAYNPFNNI